MKKYKINLQHQIERPKLHLSIYFFSRHWPSIAACNHHHHHHHHLFGNTTGSGKPARCGNSLGSLPVNPPSHTHSSPKSNKTSRVKCIYAAPTPTPTTTNREREKEKERERAIQTSCARHEALDEEGKEQKNNSVEPPKP